MRDKFGIIPPDVPRPLNDQRGVEDILRSEREERERFAARDYMLPYDPRLDPDYDPRLDRARPGADPFTQKVVVFSLVVVVVLIVGAIWWWL